MRCEIICLQTEEKHKELCQVKPRIRTWPNARQNYKTCENECKDMVRSKNIQVFGATGARIREVLRMVSASVFSIERIALFCVYSSDCLAL